MTDDNQQLIGQAIEALRSAVLGNEVSAEQLRAANIVLQRVAPTKEDADAQKRADEERARVLAEARRRLADFIDTKFELIRLRNDVVRASQAPADHAAGELARLADTCRPWVGQNSDWC